MTRGLMSLMGGAFVASSALSGVASAQSRLDQAPSGQAAERIALERQVQQAMARNVRRQLNLDDQKMRSLQQVDRKYQLQRVLLQRDERGVRLSLKAALEDSTASNDAQIAQHMDELTQIMRQRVDLLEAEQKELSVFLSPRQRAQYLVLRERVTKRLEQLRAPPGAGGQRGLPPPER